MFALLPLVGGLILGLLVPRRLAIAVQIVAVAAAAMTLSAPDHGGSYTDAFWLVPILALAGAATLATGLWIAHRRTSRQQIRP